MNEIGQKLQQARMARGLSLDEIARTTRVPRSSLEAIEAGERDLLPAEVFVRGFVRSYALAVELQPEPLLQALADARQASEENMGEERGTMPSLEARMPTDTQDHYALLLSDGVSDASRMRFGPAALVAVAVVLFVAAWLMVGTRTTRGPATAEPTTPVLHQNHVDSASTTVGLDAR